MAEPYNPSYDNMFVESNVTPIKHLSRQAFETGAMGAPVPLFSPDPSYISGVPVGESKYDLTTDERFITDSNIINTRRNEMQPWYSQAFNSVIGGVVSGLGTAIEDMSYILDFKNNIGRLLGVEEVEDNAFSEAMKEFKSDIATSMPIYHNNPSDAWDWSDSASYWEGLKGILDSTIGFAIPGMAIGKGINATLKSVRGLEFLKGILTANRVERLSEIGTGLLTNYAEGKMMGIEVYENSLADMKSNYYNDILSKYVRAGLDSQEAINKATEEYTQGLANGKEAEFKKLAGDEADKFQLNNMVFIASDVIGLHGLFKAGKSGFTRNLLEKQSLKNKLFGLSSDNLILQGAKEGAEEIGQEIMQREAEYRAAENAGISTGESSNLIDRIIKFGTSDSALVQGAMGFLGGGVQRVMMKGMSGQYGKKYNQSLEDEIAKQQDQITSNKEFLATKFNNYQTAGDIIAAAENMDDNELSNIVKNNLFATKTADNFATGTTQSFEDDLKEIKSLSKEEAIKRGYSDDYVSRANSMLSELKVLEKDWNKTSAYTRPSEIFENIQTRKLFSNLFNITQNRVNTAKNKVIEFAKPYTNDGVNLSTESFEKQEFTTNKEINDRIINSPEFKEYTTLKDKLNTISNEVKSLDDIYDKLTSFETQQKDIEAAKTIKETINKLNSEEKKKAAEVKRKQTYEKVAKEKEIKKQEDKVADDYIGKKEAGEDFIEPSVDMFTTIEDKEASKEEPTTPANETTPEIKIATDINPEAREQLNRMGYKDSQLDKLSVEDRKDILLKGITPEEFFKDTSQTSIQDKINSINQRRETTFNNFHIEKGKNDLYEYYMPPDGTIEEIHGNTEEEIKNKINAKYDAELTALGVSPEIKPESNIIDDIESTIEKESYDSEYTLEKNDDIIKDIISIEKDIIEDSGNIIEVNDGNPSYDYDRIEQGNNVLAFLSREYKRLYNILTNSIRIEDINNSLNTEMLDKSILSKNRLKIGDSVTLRVDNTNNTKVYKVGNERVTWEEFVATNNITPGSDEWINFVPIAVYDNLDKKIAHIHSMQWINEENVYGNVEEDKKKLFSLRRNVVTNGELSTTISEKTLGKLFKTYDNQLLPLKEAMPNPELIIGIGKDNIIYTNRGESGKLNKEILNKSVKNGIAYALIDANNKYIGIPLNNVTLNKNDISLIIDAIKTYTINDKENTLRKSILENTGYDIITPGGIDSFLQMYINNYKLPSDGYISGKSIHHILSVNNGSIFFGIGGDNVKSLQFINQKTDGKMLDVLLDKLSKHLEGMYYNVSLTHLNNNESKILQKIDNKLETTSYNDFIKSILKTNVLSVNIGTGDNPEYTSFIQPVIQFNNDIIDEDIETTTTIETTPISPIEPIEQQDVVKDEYSDFYLNTNVDELPDTYNDVIIESSKLIYSEELGAAKQKQIVDYVRGKILNKLFTEDNIEDIGSELDNIKQEYINLIEAGNSKIAKALEENNEVAAKRISDYVTEVSRVVGSWDVISRLTKEQVAKINGINYALDLDNDDEVTQDTKETFDSDRALTMDAIYKLSVKVKRLLGNIKRVNADGSSINNYLNQEIPVPFDIVYNTLQSITANTDPDINVMLFEMNKYVDKFPWINQVIDILKNADENIVNGFVTGMTNHTHNMKFIMWSRDDKGNYILKEYDSNSNSLMEATKALWKNNMLYDSQLGLLNASGQIIGNKDIISQHTSIMDSWIKNNNIPTDAEIKAWLNTIGIELSEGAFNKLKNNKIKGNNYSGQFNNSSGIFKILNDNLKSLSDNVIESSTFFSDSSLKELAKLESEFRVQLNSNSFRSGTKTIFTYGNNKYLVNQVRRIKKITKIDNNTYTSPELSELVETSFTKNSYWLDDVLIKDSNNNPIKASNGEYLININSPFLNNLNHGVVSLEAIKEMGAKSKDNQELYKLSPMAIEVFKIGLLQATRSDLSNNNKRIIGVTYPTTSDKTTVMTLQTIAFNSKYDSDANITDGTLDKLYDILVLPELERIISFQALDNNNKPNNKAYSGGMNSISAGADRFILFPEFNNISGLFNNNGKISPDAYNDEFKKEFKDLIKLYIDSLVKEKLEFWENVGIGQTIKNKEGKIINNNSFLNNEFINKSLKEGYGFASENVVKFAATDMVVQYLVSNAECFKMFIGDPAQFWKPKSNSKNIIDQIKDTFENIGKRLAADIAPGIELSNSLNDNYIQIILKDSKLTSKEYNNRLKRVLTKSDLSKYGKSSDVRENDKDSRAESTDAQEYTTWKEHIKVLNMRGDLSKEQYELIYDKLSNDKKLTYKELGLVLQPIKPVYVDNINIPGGLRSRVYIKSSSFPLIKQLTKNLELDKLRIALEELESNTNKTVRAAYNSAVKVGGFRDVINIWDENGNIIKDLTFIPKEGETPSWTVLNRKGFRIQQDIPYDPNKSEITEVTQASKNLFINMLDVNGFKVDWLEGEYTGKQLRDIYNGLHGELYKIGLNKLKKELLLDNGNVDVNKLKKLVEEEAIKRNYNISEKLTIRLDNELSFLPFSAVASKYQAILNALVYNRVIKQKIHGKSFVLGSAQGFKEVEDLEEYSEDTPGIVFTDTWNKELMPMGGTEDIITPAQVLIPWKFKDHNGNKLNIKDFINPETKRIDFNKLPQEVLMGFGMRIPNQGPNSQVMFEIVGFIPEESGDLIIATNDLVVQMGSDFDVDKLYTYLYNISYNNSTGKISKISLNDFQIRELYDKRYGKDDATDSLLRTIFGEEYDAALEERFEEFKNNIKSKALIQNQIIDIHRAVHTNPTKDVQAAISQPLGTWLLEDIAKEIVTAKNNRKSGELFTGLSESYQTNKFIQATAGKAGVGIFSLDSMLNALIQGTGMAFPSTSKNPFRVAFGNKVSKGLLDHEKTLDGTYYISDVIAGYQSGAVDNEKLQVLDKLNINSETFDIIRLLNQLGFGEETLWFITQDIIFDYVKELKKLKGIMGQFISNSEQVAYETVINKPQYKTEFEENEELKFSEPGLSILKSLVLYQNDLNNTPEYPVDYAKYQIALLNKFRDLSEYADTLGDLQRAINIDSKGFGKSLIESELREEQFFKAINSPILNASKLFGEVLRERPVDNTDSYIHRRFNDESYYIKPTTIPGLAATYGLFQNNDLWHQVFPLNQLSIKDTMREIETILGREDKSFQNKSELRFDVWNSIKSYLFTNSNSLFGDSDIKTLRYRLTKDVYTTNTLPLDNGTVTSVKEFQNKSLATIVNELKTSAILKNNSFIQRLNFRKDSTNPNYPSIIEYNASAKEGIDETQLYIDFVDLFIRERELGTYNNINYTTKSLAEDLVKYSYITGGNQGAIEFLKVIPPAYLKSIGFMQEMSDIDFNEFNALGDILRDNDNLPYWDKVSIFATQYVQHNPSKIKEKLLDDLSQITDVIKTDNKISSFRLDTKNNAVLSLYKKYPGIQDLMPPIFITMYAAKEPGKYFLFKFDGVRYNKIPVLGVFGSEEYEFGSPIATSIYNNNIISLLSNNIEYNTNTPKIINNITPTTILDKLEVKSTINGKKQLTNILTNISKNGGFNGIISDIILNSYLKNNNIIPEFKLQLDNLQSFGAWDSDNRILKIDKDSVNKYNDSEISNKLLHEIIHIITVEDLNNSIKNGVDSIKDINKKKVIINLNTTLRKYKEYLNTTYKEEYDIYKNKIELYKKSRLGNKEAENKYLDAPFTERELSLFYSTENIKEFVAQVLSDPELQKELNSIPDDNELSLFEKIKKLLVDLFKSIFDFDFKDNSLLATALGNSIELIQSDNTTEDNIEVITPEEYIYSIPINENIPSDNDEVIEELLPLGYPTINDIEEIKKHCK